jgi:4-hydroxybenzoate polyprenyltransferase
MKLLDFIFAARPMLHLPIWSIYLVALYYHHQLSGGRFRVTHLVILVSLSLLAAGAYYINQVYDRDSDAINRKLGFLQAGLLTEKDLMRAYLVVSVVPVIMGLFYSFFITGVFLQVFVLGYLYSCPPLRLKDRPFWGLFANAYAFGFLGPLTVMPELTLHNIGLLGWDNPIYFFLVVASVYLLTTLPDRAGDRATGKRTLSVLLTPSSVKLLALLLMLLGAYVAYRSNYLTLACIALVSALPVLLSIFTSTPSLELFATKFPILLLTILAGYLYPVYLLFIIVLMMVTRIYYRRRFNIIYPKLT